VGTLSRRFFPGGRGKIITSPAQSLAGEAKSKEPKRYYSLQTMEEGYSKQKGKGGNTIHKRGEMNGGKKGGDLSQGEGMEEAGGQI